MSVNRSFEPYLRLRSGLGPSIVFTVAALLSSACTQTLTQALARLPSVQPASPITVADTVIAAVLLEALTTQYGHGPRVIIANAQEELSPASLPPVDTLAFLLLNPDQIQQLADEYGDLSYLRILRWTVSDSVATVSIGVFGAFSRARTNGPIVDGPSSCEWRVARRGGQWRVQGTTMCVVS